MGRNEKYGVSNVALLDISSRKLTWVTDLKWDADPGEFSSKGDRFTYSVNEDGRTDLYLVDRSSQRATSLAFPPGVSDFHRTATGLSFRTRIRNAPVTCGFRISRKRHRDS